MSDYFRFAAGARLDRALGAAIEELKPRPPAPAPQPETRSAVMQPVTPPKPRSAGAFFALVDRCAGSERRLDELALPLAEALDDVEKRTAEVISNKLDDVAKVHDYLDRLQGKVKQLAETNLAPGANKGPPLEPGSAASPPASSDAPPAPGEA